MIWPRLRQPPSSEGGLRQVKRLRRARLSCRICHSYTRHCEERLRRSNPCFLRREMDCFASLAMTSDSVGWVERPRAPKPQRVTAEAKPIATERSIDGFRGVYHRARIRATRWLYPSYAF